MKWKAQFWRSPESQFAFCLVFLFLVQAWQTHAFWHRLVLEDAAESLRAPYWFVAERTVYNGVACDLPYYVALSLAYKIFGFSVYMAKILRLGLHAFSLLALAELLRRWLGARQALVPLAAAGLSPTWLYLNTNQVQLGIDLQLMPILMLGALLLPLSGHPARCFLSMMAWAALFLICAMIFPSSVFYGPVMAAFLLGRWLWQPARIGWGWLLGGALLGAVLPIAASLLALKDPQLLIYDPVTKAGLFRGGGGGFSLDPKAFAESAVVVLQDLFIEGTSYNFDLPYAEFSSWISRISFTLLMMGAILWPLLNGRNSNRTQNWVGAWLLGSLLFLFCAPQLLHKFPRPPSHYRCLVCLLRPAFFYLGWMPNLAPCACLPRRSWDRHSWFPIRQCPNSRFKCGRGSDLSASEKSFLVPRSGKSRRFSIVLGRGHS